MTPGSSECHSGLKDRWPVMYEIQVAELKKMFFIRWATFVQKAVFGHLDTMRLIFSNVLGIIFLILFQLDKPYKCIHLFIKYLLSSY